VTADERRVPLRVLIETSLAKVSMDITSYDVDAALADAPVVDCAPRVDAKEVLRGIAARKKKAEDRRKTRQEETSVGEDGEPETEDEREEREDREALEKLLRR
jgi:hypothetical protein